ncbi:MAG: hypothetical protein WCV89_02020 [Candidatus Paceibacterota bacterium]
MKRKNLIVELDAALTPADAVHLVLKLAPHVGGFKIGLRFVTSILAQLVSARSDEEANFKLKKVRSLFYILNEKVFFDGEFNDIPDTVVGTLETLQMLDVQVLSGYVLGNTEKVVVGLPITAAPDPVEAAKKFAAEIAKVS